MPFRVETDETPKFPHAPATMAGGVAVFDYNKDGRPDIFFANGANIETLKKDAAKFSNRLFRNDGNGVFTDVTREAGLAGAGYDMGVAVGDYDNDGFPDIFIAGVRGKSLYHNNGDGTFTNVTAKAGLDRCNDPKYGPLWSNAAVWVDVNSDGLLDLFVLNYLQWDLKTEHLCGPSTGRDYCSPRFYEGQPNQLFLNRGDGTFEDASEKWGIREFRDKLASYLLESEETVAITRHGDTVGYYIPVRRKRTEAERAALKEAASRLQEALTREGISEDEVLNDFKRLRRRERK